jgi:hypothetical protein
MMTIFGPKKEDEILRMEEIGRAIILLVLFIQYNAYQGDRKR